MFEQFSNYPDVKWHAAANAQFIGLNDKIQINPDLENFKLERFKDLRKQPMRDNTIMLFDNTHKTVIFLDGPDFRLDQIYIRLPKYMGKKWIEIKNMSLERDFISCANAFTKVCDSWLRDNMELKPLEPGEEVSELDLNKADSICAHCEHFDPK